jgi:hypothetical protein
VCGGPLAIWLEVKACHNVLSKDGVWKELAVLRIWKKGRAGDIE